MWLCNHCQANLHPLRILNHYPTALLVPSTVPSCKRSVVVIVPLKWDPSRSILSPSRGSQNKYGRIAVSTGRKAQILLWIWPEYRTLTWGRSHRTCHWGTWFRNGHGRRRYRWVWFNTDGLFLTLLGCFHQETRHADSSTLAPLFFRVFQWRFQARCTAFAVFRRLSSPFPRHFQVPRSWEAKPCRFRIKTSRSCRRLLFHWSTFLLCCLSSSLSSLHARASRFPCRDREKSADRILFTHRIGKSCTIWRLLLLVLPEGFLESHHPQ